MLTIQQAQRLLRTGAITSEQLVLFLRNTSVRSRQSDQRRQQGILLSPLDGIPFSVKANLAVASLPLTAGSAILETPASVGYHSQVVDALFQSGALFMGSTVMDEFGMGSLGNNRCRGSTRSVTKNPMAGWHYSPHTTPPRQSTSDDADMTNRILQNQDNIDTNNLHSNTNTGTKQDGPIYSPGGSSSGSAVTVAQQAALFSLGSDTGGSVRLPAAWCGITGYKPTYGTLSRDGLVAYASSLDTVGILAPTAHCIAVVLEQLLRQQEKQPQRDSTLQSASIQFTHPANNDDTNSRRLDGFQVAMPTAFIVQEMSHEIRDNWWNAARQLEELGATIHVIDANRISPRILQQSLAAYYVLACAEATSNLGRYDGFRYGLDHESLPSSIIGSTKEESSSNTHSSSSSAYSYSYSLLEQQYAKTRTKGFGKEVIRRILCGTSVLSSDHYHTQYEAAAKLRAVLSQQMQTVLNQYDMLLVPTTLHPPPDLQQPIDATHIMANDIMTVPASLGDSLNAPFARMSLQLVAAQKGEEKVFRVAQALHEMEL